MSRRNGQSGYVLVVAAFTIVILLGFSALAIDVGVFYGARTAAQRAADAAALAGALTFILSPSATDPQGLAENRARSTAYSNLILRKPILPDDVHVDVDYANRRVTVDVTQAEDTYFAKALFVRTITVHAQGIAEASNQATGSKCVKPWFIPNSIFAQPGVNACQACLDPEANLLVDPDTLETNKTLLPDGAVGPLRGHEFTIKPKNPKQALRPGDFMAIDLWGDPSGGNDYRNAIATCAPETELYCLNEYSVKTGDMVGPTRQGVEGGASLDEWLLADPPDTWRGYAGNAATYWLGGGPEWSDLSKQVVVAPVWDTCHPPLDCSDPAKPDFPGGTQPKLRIVGFALVFVDGMKGSDVVVHLLDVRGCGLNPPTSTETGPFATPLRLVRVN